MTLHLRDQRGAASLRYRNRAVITVLMCEQKPAIRYGFHTGGNAIRYGVNIALNIGRRYLKLVEENKTVKTVV